MTTPDELLRLAERVEAGEDGRHDRPLAEAIYEATGNLRALDAMTSLDAVEALRQRLLPGSMVTVDTIRVAGAIEVIAAIWPPTVGTGVEAYAPTEARARLAALLRAVAGKEA